MRTQEHLLKNKNNLKGGIGMEKWYEFTVTGNFTSSNQLRVRVPENHWIMMETVFNRGDNLKIMDVIDCNTGKKIWINFERITSIVDIREVEYNGQD